MNKKIDLIWIIPEITGSIGIAIIACLYLYRLPSISVIGYVNWIFSLCLVMLVILEIGFKGMNKGLDEFKKIKW